jgi:hypothetical protein
VSLVASALVRFYFRAATLDDPRKLVMTDPWVRARLAQLKGGAPGNLPAEPGAGTPPGGQ